MTNSFLSIPNMALFLSTFLVTYFFTLLAKNNFHKLGFVDIPNSRSNHKIPVALGGGMVVVPIIILGGYFYKVNFSLLGYLVTTILFFISLLDDIKNINALLRLALHMSCIFFYVHNYFAERIEELFPFLNNIVVYTMYAFTVITITWFINGFNFMDGIDGITSIQVLHIIISLIILEIFMLNNLEKFYFIILGTMLGFLIFNWHPAKIFLGDSGSIPLGFLMACLLLEFSLKGYWASALILIMYYLFDTTITLFKRIIKGRKFWKSHNEHFYQLVVKSGKSHREVCFFVILISVGLFFLSFLCAYYGYEFLFIFIAAVWCLSFICYFSKLKKIITVQRKI